jgi:hypothetical protein
MMQADNYPTLNRTLPEYFRLISRLEAVKDSKEKPCKSIREAASLGNMNEYFAKNDDSPTAFVATMCDPRFKLAIFEHLWKDNSSYIKRAKIHFKETYRKRATRQRNIEVHSQVAMAALIVILQLRRAITGFLKAQSITRKETSRRFG